ncbi:MAG: putative transporter-binding protein precursor [Acidobacteria bacterium]|nr:putative transporter-binding protein precursor [Acidobacteriota bacterium]
MRLSNLHAKTKRHRFVARHLDRAGSWPVGQILTRLSRRLALSVAAVSFALLAVAGCRSNTASDRATTAVATREVPRGGELLASVRSEPRSFNRHAARDTTTNLVSNLTQSRLIRVNQATQAVEPSLAESWTIADQGRRVTLTLRQGIHFSDGHPFTADDVVFSFEAAYDEKSGSLLADSIQAGGRKLQVTAPDPHTIVITFPAPFAPGIRILDTLPILPRHKLDAAVKAGTLTKAWGLDTPPAEVVGLGPFVLREYVPGQRLIFARNPHYFLKAPDGGALPYLDRLVLEVIPDQSAELLRLESGQLDMMTSEIAPEAYAPLKRAADQGRVKLLDLGVSRNADGLWFNLRPGALGGDGRAAWLQRDELRHAISMAVDRRLFADTVFFGAGVPVYGPETPANKVWYWPGLPQIVHDPAAAKTLLASIGLIDRNGDGLLEDAQNRPARFTLLTQKGRVNLERGAAVIRDELTKIGLTVDIVALDARAVIDQILHARYEAIYFNADKGDLDPGTNPDFWFSAGTSHMWNLEEKAPATPWERQIDDLMTRQIASADMTERKALYNDIQKIFAEHEPIVYFVAPRIYVAHAARVTNLTPAEYRPQLLWRPDTVAVSR